MTSPLPLYFLIFAQNAFMIKAAEEEYDIDITKEPEELFERMTIIVDKGQEPVRIDKFLVARTEHATRNKVQKAIENGRVLVNQKAVQSNYKIRPQDEIIVYSDREVQGEEIIPEKIQCILFNTCISHTAYQ